MFPEAFVGGYPKGLDFGARVGSRTPAGRERAVAELRRQSVAIDDQRLRRMSPLGWDHVNLTGDYVWSDSPAYDADGLRPLNREAETLAA